VKYSIDATYDVENEFCSKFETLKNDYLKKAIELDLQACEKKLKLLSSQVTYPKSIFDRVYQQQIHSKVQQLPLKLKESWESAIKRCEYAFSCDATELLEKALVEFEKSPQNLVTKNVVVSPRVKPTSKTEIKKQTNINTNENNSTRNSSGRINNNLGNRNSQSSHSSTGSNTKTSTNHSSSTTSNVDNRSSGQRITRGRGKGSANRGKDGLANKEVKTMLDSLSRV